MNNILNVLAWLIVAVMLLSGGQAAASTNYMQNEFMTAEALDPGMTKVGIHFTLGDHSKNYYPEIRYGMGALMEVGVKFGVNSTSIDGKDKLGALVGVDLKYQLVKETEGIPLDLSVDLGFDNTIVNNKNASITTFSTIISKGFPLTDRGYKFVPYGGLEMAALGGSLINESKTSMYVIGGIEWKLTQKFMLLLELKTGASTLGGAGIRFEY